METTRPTHIEVADHFYHDSIDLLKRYEHCIESEFPDFSSLKSRRMKCFIDLRMAMESALKSVVSYYCHSNLQGKKLVQKVENYRHHMDKLKPAALPHLPEEVVESVSSVCDQLQSLPVGLRYRLDVMDFISNREEEYYNTIGSDTWMDSTAGTVWGVSKFIGKELNKESRIIGMDELMEEFFQPRYEKYAIK